jgi:tetratricopeptide (TPR) repeat protein/SAM-dependent methyltransferase
MMLAGKDNKMTNPIETHSPMPAKQEQTLTIQQTLDLAFKHHTAGDLPKAEGIYNQILQADPNQPVALHFLGLIAHQIGENYRAVKLIGDALKVKPDYLDALGNLGNALVAIDEYHDAIANYQKALNINHTVPELYNAIGLAYRGLGDLNRAIKNYKIAIAKNSNFTEAYHNLGNALVKSNKIDEAVINFKKAHTLNPHNAETLYNLGLAYNEIKRFDDAVENFNKAVFIRPDYAEVHHHLGNTHQATGNLDEAIFCYSAAISIKPDYAEAHNNLGTALHELGKFDEALESYNKAITIKPNYVDAHYNLGISHKKLGKLGEAVTSYNKAISIKPDYVKAHYNIANALKDLGQLDEAVASYNKALAIKPDYVEAHYNIANALKDLGQLDEAVASYNKALAIKPDDAEAHYNLGIAFKELGKQNESFIHHRHAIKLNPENKTFWAGLADSLRQISFTTVDDDLLRDLLTLVDQPTVSPAPILRSVLSALGHHAEFALALKITRAVKPDSSLNFHRTVAQLSGIPLFLRLIILTHVDDLNIERMLTTLRYLMLQKAVAGKIKDNGLPFASALALHCFTNEYVFAETAEETLSVEHLEKKISEHVKMKQEVPLSLIVTLGAYRPLHKFDWAQGLTEHEWSKEVSAVIERQVLEPLTELSVRPQIPCLTPVQDIISQSVRDQYEENPYPRWVITSLFEKGEPIGAVLTAAPNRYSLGDYETPNNPEVLIAGCGTGQHPLGTATRFKGSRVLAIDLSLSSLSYAARKTKELGVTNIEYAQADIMELGTLDRQFDLIESAGVLHHLGDPMAGWKVLVDLLRPGGLMKIGLYSEAARQSIVSGRSMIAEMGYTSSTEDIRRCRQDIISRVESGNSSLEKLLNLKDFFSLSECRDLLFHVQEHRFTIPQIGDALDVLNLKFLGFTMRDHSVIKKFKEVFTKEGDLTSLALWHEFEEQYPDTFIGMYQFWCIKQ